MILNKKVAFALIAERDFEFFFSVAERLKAAEYEVSFITFHEPAYERLFSAGYRVFNIHSVIAGAMSEADLKTIKITEERFEFSVRDLVLHERLTFNRHDEDRLAVKVLAYLQAIGNWLERERPGVVVQELGGFIAPLTLFQACRARGIRHLFLEPMLFKGTVGFVENSINYSIPKIQIPQPLRDEVSFYIRGYNDLKTVVIPDKDRHHFKDAKLSKLININNVSRLFRKLWQKYVKGQAAEYDAIFNHVVRYSGMVLNRMRIAKYYQCSRDIDSNVRYVYFPLHVPLDFQLTVRSPEWLDQIALLEGIARFLPHGVELWIKEHPAMIGSYSRSELSRLLRCTNVRVIHPSENSYGLVRQAAAVVTINSKVGAEALMQSKAVFVLGQAFYRNQGVCFDISSTSELRQKLNGYLEGSSSENHRPDKQLIEDFLVRVWNYSLPGELYVNTKENLDRFTNSLIKALEGPYSLPASEAQT
jgi:hypothetical protein